MKTIKLLTLLTASLLTSIAFASTDYFIYRDSKGMPHCLEESGKNGSSLMIVWNEFSNLKKRPVLYRKFDNKLNGNVCKNWQDYDPTFLMIDARAVIFDGDKAPEYLENFYLVPKLRNAISQIHLGMNRYLDQENMRDEKYLKKLFEPFNMQTHKDLLKDVGANKTTELYHNYTKVAGITDQCSKLIGTCEYYLCREKYKTCGAEGYFLGFGYQYCSDSLKRVINTASPVGKKWLKTTATCLQQQMESIDNSLSCQEMKKQAIASHDKCYSEVSFCSLKVTDMVQIFESIHPALLESGVITEGVQVLGHCAGI